MKKSNLIWGLFLIGIGFIFLADNIGWIRYSFWEFATTYWPVFVIAAGVDMLIKGYSRKEKNETRTKESLG